MRVDELTLDQAATGHRPNWYDQLDEPAVRAGIRNKQHRADPTADEPRPACGAPIPDQFDWQAEEKSDDRDECHHQHCWGTPSTQQSAAPAHVQEAARDDRQLDLSSARWSQ